MIDTSDTSHDTRDRVATLIFEPSCTKILIGRAPNRPAKPFNWDVVGKGHIEVNSDTKETCVREVYEESNIVISNPGDLIFLGKIKYRGGYLFVYSYVLESMPTDIRCNCEFEWYGKMLPEFKEFKWVTLDEAKTYLYKGLVEALFSLDILK